VFPESPVEDKPSIQRALERNLQSSERTELILEGGQLRGANLAISRLRIESPMELTMALMQAGGALGIYVYEYTFFVRSCMTPSASVAGCPAS
jgi:hypothetical protein